MVWITNMHQHFLPLICLSGKNAVTDVHFSCMSVIYVSQQDSYGTVPPKSTLSKLDKWFYVAIGNSWVYI